MPNSLYLKAWRIASQKWRVKMTLLSRIKHNLRYLDKNYHKKSEISKQQDIYLT